MRITGQTVPYAVLGHPVGHTRSPLMHQAAFDTLGMDAVYLAFDVAPERLMATLAVMAEMGFAGINLTVPLKEVAFRGLADLDPSAQRLGAVNTVACRPGGLRGYNTDGTGFRRAVSDAFGAALRGRAVLVLGAGGAGRAVALTCGAQDAASIAVTDLVEERARQVARELDAQGVAAPVTVLPAEARGWAACAREADLVVNATTAGMQETDPPLLGPDAFRPGQMVFDLIYMYPRTALMRAAEAAGARTANGLGMLLHQGAEAFTIWTGRPAPLEAMRAALVTDVYGGRPDAS